MKPTRNKVYCNGCHRSKMLFESEAKANNFIKFNANEIKDETGVAPVRSYYCAYCGGYHVTSCKSAEIGKHFDRKNQKEITQIREQKQKKKKYSYKEELIENHNEIAKEITHACEYLYFGKFAEARECLDSVADKIDKFSGIARLYGGDANIVQWWKKVSAKKEAILFAISIIEQNSSEKLEAAKDNLAECGINLSDIISNLEIMRQLDAIIDQNELLVPLGEKNKIRESLKTYNELIQKLVVIGRKETINKYSAKIHRQFDQACHIAKGNNPPAPKLSKLEREMQQIWQTYEIEDGKNEQ
jgi:hypothetical protein